MKKSTTEANSENIKPKTLKKKSTATKTKKTALKRATADDKIKEKKNTTVNEEIIYCIENNLLITVALLSKRVGVSTHRINKYCKSNYIDLNKINKSNYLNMLDPKRVKELKKQEKVNAQLAKEAAAAKKIQDKIDKSLSKKNINSTKHKLPILVNSENQKIKIEGSVKKIKIF